MGGRAAGAAAAALGLDCAVRGPHQPPPAVLPPIADRAWRPASHRCAGPGRPDWLQACAPPEASAQDRLAAAIEVTRQHPVPLLAGDVVDALPGLLDRFPPGQPLVVVDAYLAVFLPANRRARLAAILAEAGRARPVTWLSLDPLVPLGPGGRDSVQGLPLPGWLVRDYSQWRVRRARRAHLPRGADQGQVLARAHPSGQWVEWLGSG